MFKGLARKNLWAPSQGSDFSERQKKKRRLVKKACLHKFGDRGASFGGLGKGTLGKGKQRGLAY